MAETRTTRSETSKEGSQSMARPDRERGTTQSRDYGWLASPYSMFDRMAEEVDRTFDRMIRDFGSPRRSWLTRGSFHSFSGEGMWAPRVEAFQKGDRFIVRADLPGLKRDDIQVELTDDVVTIHGDRQEEHQEQREGYYRSEREYGHFFRTIPLPEGVITESAQATFKNGVLEISMQAPPAEASRGRKLEIKDSSESGDKR